MEKNIAKAVIFDFDGTLVDSEPVHIIAWKKAGDIFNVPKDFDYSVGLGASDKALSDIIVEKYNVNEKILDEKNKILSEMGSAAYKVYDKVFETIKKLYDMSIPMAIASNSSEEYIRKISSHVGIDRYINYYSGYSLLNNKIKPKPSADLYISALNLLNIEAQYCIAVEDSMFGIQSSKNAGIFTFGITNTFDEHKLKDSNHIITRIDEIFNYIDFIK